jgi:hypothetical protein
MLAKKEWFKRRKYGWWWVSPKTWQWWVYIWIMVFWLSFFQALWVWDDKTRLIITWVWLFILLIDMIPIMLKVDRDEMEQKIEAVSERNAAWWMSFILVIWILYELIKSSMNQEISVNIFLILALLTWVIIKSISNYILEKKWI